MSSNVRFSTNQNKALAALLASTSIRAAADRAGLCEKTLSRYLSDSQFSTELARREGEMIDQGVRWLAAELESVLGTISEIRNDQEAAPGVRLRAATDWIRALKELRTLRDIEQRLTALEVAVYGNAKR